MKSQPPVDTMASQIWAITFRQKLTSIAQREANRWPDKWSDENTEPYPDPLIKH